MTKDDDGSREAATARTVTEIETSAFYGDQMFRINLCAGTSVTFQLTPNSDHIEVYTSPSYGQGELDHSEVVQVIAQLATLAGCTAQALQEDRR
ncbi:MAG: hypothetical protein ACRDTG_23535 [Pseudonocardiaceae bacterium]